MVLLFLVVSLLASVDDVYIDERRKNCDDSLFIDDAEDDKDGVGFVSSVVVVVVVAAATGLFARSSTVYATTI